jgi:fucose permease
MAGCDYGKHKSHSDQPQSRGAADGKTPAFHRGCVTPDQMIAMGLALSTVLATCLFVMTIAGGKSTAVVVSVMIGVALSFGLISPNATDGALRPMPDIAGSISAVMAFVQMIAAAASSALVASLFDGRSALSMAQVMLSFCLLAVASVGLVGRAKRFTLSHEYKVGSGKRP